MHVFAPDALDMVRRTACKLSAGSRIELQINDGSCIVMTSPAASDGLHNADDIAVPDLLRGVAEQLPLRSNVTMHFPDGATLSMASPQPALPQKQKQRPPPRQQQPTRNPSTGGSSSSARSRTAAPRAQPPRPQQITVTVHVPANLGANRRINFTNNGTKYAVRVPDHIKPGGKFNVALTIPAPGGGGATLAAAATPAVVPPAPSPKRQAPKRSAPPVTAAPAPAPAAADGGAADELHESLVGRTVTIVGLVSKPQLNGTQGVVSEISTSQGRYLITLPADVPAELRPGTGLVALRPHNIIPHDELTTGTAGVVSSAASHTPGAPAPGSSSDNGLPAVLDEAWVEDLDDDDPLAKRQRFK